MAKQLPLYAALEPLGFETAGQVCFGSWKGYAVSLRLDRGYYWADFAVRPERADGRLQKALAASFKAATGKGTTVNASSGKGRVVSFLFRPDRKTSYSEQFSAFADACADALGQQGLAPAQTCAVCGAAAPESLCFIGSYQPVHSVCMRSALEKTREAAADNQENGSYLTGLVGALLGMLVGLIPSVLLGVLTDRIYALLFALVPLAAMWCYRKFNGKMSKGSIGIIILVSLLGVLVMQYFNLSIAVMQGLGMSFGEALSYAARKFLEIEVFAIIISESLMYFVFMALGIFIAWRYLSQTNGGNVAGMEAALSTLRPNPDAAPDVGENG